MRILMHDKNFNFFLTPLDDAYRFIYPKRDLQTIHLSQSEKRKIKIQLVKLLETEN